MRKMFLLLGGGLVALLIIITSVSTLTTQLQKQHEKKAATTFIQAILSNNSQVSYSMFSSAAQTTQSKDDWTAKVQKLSSFFKGKTPTFQQLAQSSGSSAVVNYTIIGSDGKYVMSVALTKEKTGWQVFTFTSQLLTP
ncbi:MAG TPA: hypothetical protein VLG92_00810 [Candidatus Saccharimonadia bacterium]|nr:hypothetical protein [Candidatus Saccharimonadia bacterium]